MVPVCGDMVRVAGETTRLLSWSYITTLEETRTVSGMPDSFGGVYAGVGYERLSGVREKDIVQAAVHQFRKRKFS